MYEIFEDAANQTPKTGFYPYDVITPLFSDHSTKHRFLHIPDRAADRALAYLEVDCAHCHNPAGLGSHTRLDLRWIQHDPAMPGVMKKPTASGKPARDRDFAIVPGDPDASFLLQRMVSDRPDVRMPQIGRSAPDEEAAQLILDWIGSLGN